MKCALFCGSHWLLKDRLKGILFRYRVCQESPGPPSGLTICQEDSGLSIQSYSWLRCIRTKGRKAKSAEEKGAWDKVQRKPSIASKSPLPVESHRMCLIPPALHYNHTCKVSCNRDTDWSPGFLLGAGSAWHVPKFQDLKGKQVFIINHIVCKAQAQ